jgi:hypothetical protein
MDQVRTAEEHKPHGVGVAESRTRMNVQGNTTRGRGHVTLGSWEGRPRPLKLRGVLSRAAALQRHRRRMEFSVSASGNILRADSDCTTTWRNRS